MKKYSHKIAAQKIVWPNTELGLSRHKNRQLAKRKVTSVVTEKAHVSALTGYSKWMGTNGGKHLKRSSPADAMQFLKARAMICKQSTIDLDRQAINLHLHSDHPLGFVASQVPTVPLNRAYTPKQIDLLVESAEEDLGFSISLANDGGFRGMELITVADPADLKPSKRDWSAHLFCGREDAMPFVVHGKGGLEREVRVSKKWAGKLAPLARHEPWTVLHRGAHLISRFNLMGGHEFSIKFGKLSMKVLGFSFGAHGLRHSYAQRRRDEIMCCGFSFDQALVILSQELGHFHIKNTLAYLRD